MIHFISIHFKYYVIYRSLTWLDQFLSINQKMKQEKENLTTRKNEIFAKQEVEVALQDLQGRKEEVAILSYTIEEYIRNRERRRNRSKRTVMIVMMKKTYCCHLQLNCKQNIMY